MEHGRDTRRACYYVAALDIGATECRLAVQLLDADRKPIDSVKVYAQRQVEMGEGYVSNIEVTSRAVAQVAGHMSKLLGFDVKKMAVIYMVGSTDTTFHPYVMRCTVQKPGTQSTVVTEESINALHQQAVKWQENEEASGEWLVVYNWPVEYYTKDQGIKRMRAYPVGTFTDQIYSDYISVKVRKEYVNRFNAALRQSGVNITNYYLEGLAAPCVQKELLLRKGKDLYLHLGHTKSVLSEVFACQSGELRLSRYAWLSGIGTEFSIEYVRQNNDCTQEFAYERLQQDVQFDHANLEEAEFENMVTTGHFKNKDNAKITGNAMNAVGRLVTELAKTLNEWYPIKYNTQKSFYIHLSGGIAGLAGIGNLMLRCLQLVGEIRVERIDLVGLTVSYDVLSDQSEGQVRNESLCSVLGVLRQELLRGEENPIHEAVVGPNEVPAVENTVGSEPTRQVEEQDNVEQEEEQQGKKGVLTRVRSFFNDIMQGPSKPIV